MNIKSSQMFVPLFVASHQAVASTQSTQIDRLNVHTVAKNSSNCISNDDYLVLVDNYLMQLNFIGLKWRIVRMLDVCKNVDI